MNSVTRSRRLTTEEATEYIAVREQIEQEQPEIAARLALALRMSLDELAVGVGVSAAATPAA